MPNPRARRGAPANSRPKPRRTHANGPRRDKSAQHAQTAESRSELDVALAAAAALPEPPATDFGSLGLDPRIVAALAARDITMPFAIQARALPDALAGRDVLGRAETGSGKTLAFGLPLLSRVAAMAGKPRATAPRALVLVPTRELAEQVADVLKPIGRNVGLLVTTVYGGVSIARQIDRLRRGADVVVATPGRLIDLLDRQACSLADVAVTVIDEADRMADLGFLPSVTRILGLTPAGQRLLFSATLDRGVDRLVRAYLADPALHAVEPQAVAGGAAEHAMLVVDAADKVAVAAQLGRRPSRTLIFVRTKHGADRLAQQLERSGVAAAAIHGDRNQNQRQRALDAFAAGQPRVLVATDVAARGIHVDGIELVVHFDPPQDHKDYLHRSGRTARAGASGMIVALAQRDQVRDLDGLLKAAGIEPTRHDDVTAAHPVVVRLAATGTPVLPRPAPAIRPRPADAPPRVRRTSNRTARSGTRSVSATGQTRPAGRQSRPAGAQSPNPARSATGERGRADGAHRRGGRPTR